ncbi:MAG: hypothetical protein U0R44_02495 [Candidatus Micrarchaeia archaeon]
MEEDKALKEAIEACSKIIEEKCGRRPYIVVIAKANVAYKDEEDRKKGKLSGTTSYMYVAKPTMKKDGLSKLLIDASRMAVNLAEKDVMDQP